MVYKNLMPSQAESTTLFSPAFQRPHFVFLSLALCPCPQGSKKLTFLLVQRCVSLYHASVQTLSNQTSPIGTFTQGYSQVSSLTFSSGRIDIGWENECFHLNLQLSLKGSAGILHDPPIQMPLGPDNWKCHHGQNMNRWAPTWTQHMAQERELVVSSGSPEHWTHLVSDMNEGHPRSAPFWQPNPFCFCEKKFDTC